jgi:hypothetical protein
LKENTLLMLVSIETLACALASSDFLSAGRQRTLSLACKQIKRSKSKHQNSSWLWAVFMEKTRLWSKFWYVLVSLC